MIDFFKNIKQKSRYFPAALVNKLANRFGYSFQQKGQGYFDADSIVKAASKMNLTVCQYLENNNVSGVGKRRDEIISTLQPHLPEKIEKVLEVGTGTGMFLERVIELFHPHVYESYETNLGWVKYLGTEYSNKVNLVNHNANGINFDATASASVDVVFSHGVYVYLPVIKSFQYLDEMVRVCKDEGIIVFDCFSSDVFGLEIMKKWQHANAYFPVVIPSELITAYAAANQLKLIHSFDVRYHESKTRYFIFKKTTL